MKIGWLTGWAVPAPWFEALLHRALPEAEHFLVQPGPDALAKLEKAAPFDWVGGYSLGSLLLLREAARASRLGQVALFAPIFAFPREAGLGGRVARAQVRQLSRWLRRDAPAALTDFYAQAGLDVVPETGMFTLGDLLWGLDCLENDCAEPPLPAGWCAWCGDKDALLDAVRLQALSADVRILSGATHHPAALLHAFAADLVLGRGGAT